MTKICLNHYGVMVAGTKDLAPFAEGVITLDSDDSPCPFGSTEQVQTPPVESPLVCQSSEVMIQDELTLVKKCWPESEEIPDGWTYVFGGGETTAPLPNSNWWLWVILAAIAWKVYSAR